MSTTPAELAASTMRAAAGGRHRLFDKYVLTSLDSLQSQRCVACWRRRDDNRVDVRQRILDAGIRGNAMVNLLTSVTDFGKPLVHAATAATPVVDRRTRTCREPQ